MRVQPRTQTRTAAEHSSGRAGLGVAVLMASLGTGVAHATPITTAKPSPDSLAVEHGRRLFAKPDLEDATDSLARGDREPHRHARRKRRHDLLERAHGRVRVGGEDSINGNADNADLMLIATHGDVRGGNETRLSLHSRAHDQERRSQRQLLG